MASLLLAAGAGVYYKVKDTKAKHRAERDAHNSSRFSELEKENTERLSSPRLPQPRTAELASNNPFRDAIAPPTTQRTNSHTNNPFDSTEDLTTDARRGSSGSEGGGEESRAPRYESGVVVDETKKKKRRRMWGRKAKGKGLRPGGWGGKKDDGFVR